MAQEDASTVCSIAQPREVASSSGLKHYGRDNHTLDILSHEGLPATLGGHKYEGNINHDLEDFRRIDHCNR